MGVIDALLLPLLWMKVGHQVCGGGGSGGTLQVVENLWPTLEMGMEDVENLPEFGGSTVNPGWRNIGD